MPHNYTDRPPEEKPETLKPRDIKLIEQAEEYFKKGEQMLEMFGGENLSEIKKHTNELLIITHNIKNQ